VLIDSFGFITCLDLKTGHVLWTQPGRKRMCSGHGNSPVIGQADGRYYFMASRGDVHRLADGEFVLSGPEYARHVRQYWSNTVSADRRTFYAVTHAVLLPEDAALQPELLWALDSSLILGLQQRVKDDSGFVVLHNHNYAAPAVCGGKIYYFNSGIFSKSFYNILDAETGAVVVKHVEGEDIKNTYSDPIYAGKYLYHFEDSGICKIRDPADNFKLVTMNLLEPGLSVVPVFAGRRMYVRTDLSVYCIEKGEK
jgi:hypothetical protein